MAILRYIGQTRMCRIVLLTRTDETVRRYFLKTIFIMFFSITIMLVSVETAMADSPLACGALSRTWTKAVSSHNKSLIEHARSDVAGLKALCPNLYEQVMSSSAGPEQTATPPDASNKAAVRTPELAPAPIFDIAKLSPSDRARVIAAGCLPGAKVATLHASTYYIKWKGEDHEEGNVGDGSARIGVPFVVDPNAPIDGDRCRVRFDDDDPKDPTPAGAIPLVDLKPYEQVRAILAAKRYNSPQNVRLSEFRAVFHKDLETQALKVGLDPSAFSAQEEQISQYVEDCARISKQDTDGWILARMGRSNPSNYSVSQGVELTRKYLPCLETAGFGHKFPGTRVIFAKFSIRDDDRSKPYNVKIQFDLDRGNDGKPANNEYMKGFYNTSIDDMILSWFELFGIANYNLTQ